MYVCISSDDAWKLSHYTTKCNKIMHSKQYATLYAQYNEEFSEIPKYDKRGGYRVERVKKLN